MKINAALGQQQQAPSMERHASGQVRKQPAHLDMYIDDNERLHVEIDTDRLNLSSIIDSPKQRALLCELYGSAEVMQFYASGRTLSTLQTESISNKWSERWASKDPFSGFSVRLRDHDELIGKTVLGHSDTPGQAEFAFALKSRFWSQGYGTECGSAIVHTYADHLFSTEALLEGCAFSGIKATARTDNPRSYKVLEKLGFRNIRDEERYGALRHHYFLSLENNKIA